METVQNASILSYFKITHKQQSCHKVVSGNCKIS